MKTLIVILLLTCFSAYYINSVIDKVYSPISWVQNALGPSQMAPEVQKRKEQVDAFFVNVVDNIEHLKKITDSYDNYTDMLDMTKGFDKIEEFILRMERRDFLKTDDFHKLRRFVREMEKFQRRLFYQEKQNINVLKTLLPTLMISLSSVENTIQPEEQEEEEEEKEKEDWLTTVNPQFFKEYSSNLVHFLELVSDDFFEMRKLLDNIENRIMEIETTIYKSHLLAMDEGKQKHISLDIQRESNLNWLFKLLSSEHSRHEKTLEMDLLELNELERYREFVVKFLNKKRRMIGDIEDFNESVLKKTNAMSAALGVEKPSSRVLYRFAYELNSLHLLVKDRHEDTQKHAKISDSK